MSSHFINTEQLKLDDFDDYFAERLKFLLDLISDAIGIKQLPMAMRRLRVLVRLYKYKE